MILLSPPTPYISCIKLPKFELIIWPSTPPLMQMHGPYQYHSFLFFNYKKFLIDNIHMHDQFQSYRLNYHLKLILWIDGYAVNVEWTSLASTTHQSYKKLIIHTPSVPKKYVYFHLWKIIPNSLSVYINLFTTYTTRIHHYNSLNTNNNVDLTIH